MCLAFFFSNTGSSPNNLLECGHAFNSLIKNNQLCHLAVRSGGEKLRSRCDNRIRAGHRDEIIKFRFSVHIRTSDSYAVIGVLLNHIRVIVDKGNPHAFCMVFGSTEHNGLLHPVCAFQILRNLPCNLINAVLENDGVIVIPVVIDAVFNQIAVDVGLSMVGSPSISDVGRDIDNLERSEETILNTLFQTICVDRLSKIIYVRYFFAFLRCGSHTDLGSRRKILQNLTPVTVLLGAATVTLVYYNKVEIFCGYLPEMFFVILTYHLMVEGEVHFMRSNLVQAFFIGEIYLIDGLFERGEVLQNALVNQNVSVCQI